MPAHPTPPRTRVQLCGRLAIECDGAQLAPALRGRQVPLLLAYLVLSRQRAVSREELAGALWPSHPPVSQEGALRTLLSRLRSALGGEVIRGREEITLELPEPVWVDYEAAFAELERAQTALARGDGRGAWALAQIPFNIATRGLLPGHQGEFLEPFRRELEAIRLDALEVIGRAGLRLGPGQIASVERAARALIAAERFREAGYVLLMEALSARGEAAEALRIFDTLRNLLRDELGTPPSAEALAVHERLLRGGEGPARARRGGDPAPDPGGLIAAIPLPSELAVRARTPMFGRGRQLGELRRLWQAALALAGPPPSEPDRIVLLTGEPGVGKTRLLSELAAQAHGEGAVVLAGRSPQDTVVPYQPFLEALRHYVVSAPLIALSAAASGYGEELTRLMPELERRLPELSARAPADPETDRYRLFEAVVGLLAEIAASAPLLLVLDDLHWADRPTLLLLRHLARAARSDRLLVIGAYRTPGMGAGSAQEEIAAELASLGHEQVVGEMVIGGLTEADTAELVTHRMGEAPSRAFVKALHGQTDGNPLFVEEIVRALREAGVAPGAATAWDLTRAEVPEGVRRVIGARLERLDRPTYELLRTAAVIGRDFDGSLLEVVSGLDEDTFLACLDSALDARLINDLGAGRLSFSHALVRETLYEGMSSTRRARLHRRVAEALERRPSSPLAALALHYARAAEERDLAKAVDYALSAAGEATEMLAHEEAAGHLGRALELIERYSPGARQKRLDLLLRLAEARVRAGERKLAWPAFRGAAALADELDDGAAMARAAIGASRRYVQQPGVVDEELIAMIERALEMQGSEPTPMRARLLGRLCGAIYYAPQRGRMRALAAEAMAIAEQLDDPESRIYAFAARRRALWEPAELSERLTASTRMLALARQLGDLELEMQAHAWLVADLLEQGEMDAVNAQVSVFADGAETLREPLYLWNALVWRAMAAHLAGALEEAERLAAEALAAGAPTEAVTAPQYHAIALMAIRREQGRFAEVEDVARGLAEANPGRPVWRAALAALYAETGRFEQAGEQFERIAARDFRDLPQDLDWLTTMSLLADVCLGLPGSPRAARLYGMLLPYADSFVVAGLGAICFGSAQRFAGRLAAARGDDELALRHLERAREANAAMPAPLALAHTLADLAELHERLSAGRSRTVHARRAQELREEALGIAEARGLGLVRARLAGSAPPARGRRGD